MKGFTFVLASATVLALAGCGGSREEAAETAQENLEAAAENTAADLGALASNVVDADQANMLVNESLELSNAEQAVDNAEGETEAANAR
jgi:hypothetical protein